jgi:4'-phosphopantetheinyl transferase
MYLVIRECIGAARNCTPPALKPEEVHVWHWAPASPSREVKELWKTLAEDERERAQRYHFARHRDEFVVNRARVRALLASYVAKSPEQLVFEYSPHGKPSLHGESRLRFNVSHTSGRAALAVVHSHEIGVDVERIRAECDAQEIAQRFFSLREREVLKGLSGNELYQTFFRGWTRKEAYIKAKGGGLSIPLHEFDVSLAQSEAATLLSTRPDPDEARRWDLYDLPLHSGYAAALAVAAAVTQTSPAQRSPARRAAIARPG